MTFPLVRAALGDHLDTTPLDRFLEDLYRTNEFVNLTSVPREEAELRHVMDSLAVSFLVPEGASLLDVGTGAGFPAWPLAWARPDLEVTAMDSTEKRLRFLGQHLLPNLRLLLSRAELSAPSLHFGFVTGRAVAPFSIQAELSAAWVEVGGFFVPFRTPAEEAQIVATDLGVLGLSLEAAHQVPLPGTDAVRLFPVFRKTAPAAPGYPRKWADIRKRPLGHPIALSP